MSNSNSERPPGSPTKRMALLGLVAMAATAGGAWWGWRHASSASPNTGGLAEPSVSSSAASSAAASASAPFIQGNQLTEAFWQQHFDTPAGATVTLAQFKGKPLLINFWATWCPPCVKEMPELARFHREFAPKGWQVLGLAVDGPTPVRDFLAKLQVGFEVGLAGFGGTELSQALGNDAGGLPFSVLIDAQGRVQQRKMGATHFDELAKWANADDKQP